MAEIAVSACRANAVKFGLAVQWGVEAGAYLAGAKWLGGVPLTRAPIPLHGLRWPVTILAAHISIACQTHHLNDWAAFDDRSIIATA